MGCLTFYILGDKWKVIALSDKDYTKKHGNDSVGITEVDDKTIYFPLSSCNNLQIITHEISHSYFSYLCLSSVDKLDSHEFEEIVAEFISKYGKHIIKASDIIYKGLQDATKSKKE